MSGYAYVGYAACGCGHIRAAVVDDPARPAWVAGHVAEMVASGLQVQRVETDAVRVQFGRCDICDPRPPQQKGLGI